MAFVHLHNHCDSSILDAATRVSELVGRAVELEMPAVALTDHGYLFGIPNFDLECRKYNDTPVLKQWKADVAAFEKGELPAEPDADDPEAIRTDRAHGQWERDVAARNRAHDIADVRDAKPEPRIKPIFGCEAYFITDDCIERGTKQRRYHLILLAKNKTGYVNLMKMMSKARFTKR